MGIEIIKSDINALLSAANWPAIDIEKAAAAQVGC